MSEESLFSPLKKPLSTAQIVFIFLSADPSFDQVAASLSLYLILKKAGKEVSLVCPTEMRVEYSDLIGIDKVQGRLAGRNLIISFDYLEDSIEKVSYNIENDKFNLVVQPKTGFPPLSSDKVNYSYSRGEVDLTFTIGIRDLKRLNEQFQDAKLFFEKERMIDIDLVPKSTRFAQTELILAVSSFSEIITRLIANLGLPADGDIASNLMLGLEKATEGFSFHKTGAETFEAAAFLLRSGARRAILSRKLEERVEKSLPFKPMTAKISEEKKPSSDWLEPKIYKGNTKI